MADTAKREIIKLVHPEYARYAGEWVKYWLAYVGGHDFVMAYLKRYSKRETRKDFLNRVDVTYNPPESQSALNDVRDALLVRMSEVERAGDPAYVRMMSENVDTFHSSMTTFVGQDVMPRLLAQGKVFVFVDSPPADAVPATPGRPVTRAEDGALTPYLWTFSADQCRSWTYDPEGRITACMVERVEDQVDPTTGLTVGTTKLYTLLRLLAPGETLEQQVGPGVAVIDYKETGDVAAQHLLTLSRVPVVEFRIAQALMTDIAAIQVALLNLSSTDMAFLFRGNFPLYTEQYDAATDVIKPTARKRDTAGQPSQDRDVDVEDSEQGTSVGVGKGRRYVKGVERPGYVAPPTENLRASMEKQKDLSARIRSACDLALTSLSVASVEQSGESKKQDRVGLSAGLRYIATQLEAGEREIAVIVHEYLGATQTEAVVSYPDDYQMQDDDSRAKELERLKASRGAVRSETYQKELSKSIARSQLTGLVDEATMKTVLGEIDSAPFMDENLERAQMVAVDVEAKMLSKEGGSLVRGYKPGEVDKALAESQVLADQRAGFGFGSRGDVRPMGDSFSSQRGTSSAPGTSQATGDEETTVPAPVADGQAAG